MTSFLTRILSSYDSVRRLMANFHRNGRFGSTRFAQSFDSLEELALAVHQGRIEYGDLVSGSGWLSLYASWYLPGAYSPYHLNVLPIVDGERWMVRTTPQVALLPAGQLPFASSEKTVGFLYPLQTNGFAAELRPDDKGSRFGAPFERTSSDDNPWGFSLDQGIGMGSSMGWVSTVGDSSLAELLDEEEDDDNASSVAPTVFGDPLLVRRAAQVPQTSQPIPIVFPPNFRNHVHTEVEFRARVMPLDTEILAELSQLGQPLTEKAFALLCGVSSSAPFCLQIQNENGTLSPRRAASPREPVPAKIGTLLVEWYFEETQSGVPLTFDDEQLLSWFIPCAKNHVLSFGPHVLPNRWTGKMYGFEGPLYFFQTGPIGFTMSPEGLFTATHEVYFDSSFNSDWLIWKDTVTHLQRDLVEKYRLLHGRALKVRTTYLTDWSWMASFGNVLEGRALWQTAQKTLHQEKRAQSLMQELQKLREKHEEKQKMRSIRILFVSSSPTDQAPLQGDKEIRDIKERIKLARHRDLIQVESVVAARPEDIFLAFNENDGEIDIFHFSGHGSEAGELGLCAADGTFKPIPPEALAGLMRVLGQKVQVALISACYSQAQAEAIRAHVPCAIGMNDEIGDEVATVFAAAFYSAIAFGKDVQTAYDQAIVAVQMEDLPSASIPELLVKSGVDASQIRPVREADEGVVNPRYAR